MFRSGDRVDRETSRLGARPKHHPDHLRHGQQFSISTDCDDRHPTANAKKSNPAVWSPDFRHRQTWDGQVQVGCASITIKAIATNIVHHHLVLDDLPTFIASAFESSFAPSGPCFRRTCPNYRPSHRASRQATYRMQNLLPINSPLPRALGGQLRPLQSLPKMARNISAVSRRLRTLSPPSHIYSSRLPHLTQSTSIAYWPSCKTRQQSRLRGKLWVPTSALVHD